MWNKYRRKGVTEMRPYTSGEDITGISVSDVDKALPTLDGGYIARNVDDHNDMWYVSAKFFKDSRFEVVESELVH